MGLVGWVERKRNPSATAPRGNAPDGFRFAQPILRPRPRLLGADSAVEALGPRCGWLSGDDMIVGLTGANKDREPLPSKAETDYLRAVPPPYLPWERRRLARSLLWSGRDARAPGRVGSAYRNRGKARQRCHCAHAPHLLEECGHDSGLTRWLKPTSPPSGRFRRI